MDSTFGQEPTCNNQEIGRIEFTKGSSKLTLTSKVKLDSLIDKIITNTSCEILIMNSYADLCGKCGALSWDRIKSVFTYLVKKGINPNRLKNFSKLDGNLDFVSLTFTSMNFPNQASVPSKLEK